MPILSLVSQNNFFLILNPNTVMFLPIWGDICAQKTVCII
nr:MAG TPA: hypothetical protein [Caudoviricetes sp.]